MAELLGHGAEEIAGDDHYNPRRRQHARHSRQVDQNDMETLYAKALADLFRKRKTSKT